MNERPSPPASGPEDRRDKSLTQLEFSAVLERVASYCVSELGAKRVTARRPSTDRARIEKQLAEVSALAALLEEGHDLRPEPVSDLEPQFKTLRQEGGVLEGTELSLLADNLSAFNSVAGRLARVVEEDSPLVEYLFEPSPEELATRLRRAVDRDGQLTDDASADLARIRRRLREVRKRLVRDLERIAGGLYSEGVAAEDKATLRSGRYVIAVRRDHRSRLRGIVHGESASGQTIFVEPEGAVDTGNELAECRAEESRILIRVLRELTGEVRPWLDRIEVSLERCLALDDLYARSRFMLDTESTPPEICERSLGVTITNGKHPLLWSAGVEAVPFSLRMGTDGHVLVVSGPNAGGKTVLLKSVGLVSAMTQSGIPPTVSHPTRLPVFDRVFADIGDRQSIAASLSTFTGHLQNIAEVLEEADQNSLVLLDELGTGTDPNEGAALASTVLLELRRVGAVVLATTHLNQLKSLSGEVSGLANASLRFDEETLSPTYELVQGVPGRSYGLAIARRVGLPDEVVGEAETRMSEEEVSLDRLLAEAERREAQLKARSDEVEELSRRLHQEREELERRLVELQERERELVARSKQLEREGREEARRYLLDARKRVEEALGMARAAVSEVTAKEARRLVERGISEEGDALRRLRDHARKQGWKLGGESPPVDSTGTQRPSRGESRAVAENLVEEASQEVDLRGMRADEAETSLGLAIDRAVVADLPVLRIIHGKGTGALRTVTHEILQNDSRVTRYRLAPPQEGGTGVTLAEFG